MSEKTASEALVPVLDQVIDFMESALTDTTEKETKIAELKSAIAKMQADQERVLLEKVAKAKETFFAKSAMEASLKSLVGMGVIDEQAMEKLARRLGDDPNVVFPLLTKVAESLMSAPGEGSGIDKGSSSLLDVEDEDPDGWKAMAEGKPVTVRR